MSSQKKNPQSAPNSNADADLTKEDIEATQRVVADAVLKSSTGWEVLNQMHRGCAQKLLHTQGFTLPVINQLDALKKELDDPEAFTRCFQTLLGDIKQYKERLDELLSKHKDRSGTPEEKDWPVLFSISMEYSNLDNHFETVIAPLILSLIEVIREQHGDMLELTPTTDEA
jgi:hypothetical protein